MENAAPDGLSGLYTSGLGNLNANKVKEAEEDFKKILATDKKSPMGLTGLALVDLNKKRFRRSLGHVDKALHYNGDFVDALVTRGRVIVEREKKDWRQDALDTYDAALKLDPDNQAAHYYQGECYLKAYDFTEAARSFDSASKLQGSLQETAGARSLLVEKILKAGPLTESGKAIALTATIDRASLCALLIEELNLRKLVKTHRNKLFAELFHDDFKLRHHIKKVPPDISSHPNRHQIFPVAMLEVPDLTVFPDGRFYPGKKVSRAQYAVIIHGICGLLENDHGNTLASGVTVSSDVHADYYAYEAIMCCMRKNLLQVNGKSLFRPAEAVSGVDAVLAVCALRDEFK